MRRDVWCMSYLDHRLEPWCDGEDFSPALAALLAAMRAAKEKNGERSTHQDSKPDVRDAVRVNAVDEKRSTTR
jgi:hypothetical protein